MYNIKFSHLCQNSIQASIQMSFKIIQYAYAIVSYEFYLQGSINLDDIERKSKTIDYKNT